jgi:ADP-heptose:LPS heptosyltransferase
VSTVLVLRALGLGDFLTGVPALRLIRRARPQARIVLAAPAHFGELARSAGLVDAVLDYDGLRELGPLPCGPRRPDVAIDLHGNGPASRDVLRVLEPKQLIAYTITPEPGSTALWDPAEHEVARWLRLAALGLGVDPALGGGVAGSLPRPPLPPHLPAGAIVVHPGASAGSRRWPPGRFAAVARSLVRRGRPVVVTGSGAEGALAHAVAEAGEATALTTLSLDELLALVAAAHLVVSGDTGVAHAASTYAVPSVVMFGPVSPALWGPPPSPLHRALHHRLPSDRPGDPHGADVDPALLRITPDEVLDAAAAVRAAAGLGTAA